MQSSKSLAFSDAIIREMIPFYTYREILRHLRRYEDHLGN